MNEDGVWVDKAPLQWQIRHLCFCMQVITFLISTIPGNTIPDFSKKTYGKYSGTIGDKYPITMDLTFGNGQFSGNYFYDRVGFRILICGDMSDSGSFAFYACDTDSISDWFNGGFVTIDSLRGTWTNKRLKKSYSFRMSRMTQDVAPVLFDLYSKNQNEKEIYVDVPRLVYADDSVNGRVNREIKRTLISAINREHGDSSHAYRTINEFLTDFSRLFDYCDTGTMDFRSTIMTNEHSILSLKFSSYSFCNGNAHASGDDHLFNFDLTTGKMITLNELMVPKFQTQLNRIGYKKYIKEYCKWCPQSSSEYPEFKLNGNFAITHDGLLFQFYDYELGGHGAPNILIPYREIKHLVRLEGILGRFL